MIAPPLQGAIEDVERLAEEIRQELRGRYEFRRMLAAADQALWRLEEFNRDGVKRLPAGMLGKIKGSLAELPASCMEVFRDSDQVQEVLDGVFDVEERLFRWHDPMRDADEDPGEEPAPYTAADLDRWGGICRWLDTFGPLGLSKSDAPEKWAGDLVAMQRHGLLYLRDGWRWRAYTTWLVRLEKLRTQLGVG